MRSGDFDPERELGVIDAVLVELLEWRLILCEDEHHEQLGRTDKGDQS